MSPITPSLRRFDPVRTWIALLAGVTLSTAIFLILHPQEFAGGDFGAFWCAGRAVLAHANPYLNQPLHACEATNTPAFFRLFPNVTVPAPLPPYALAMFSLWSLVPYAIARAAWWVLIVACVAAEANVIAKLSGRTYLFSLAACGFATAIPAVTFGALAPIPILALTVAALVLRYGRWFVGAALLGAAMIEPHMVLPSCVACFWLLSRTRLPLLAGGLLAAVLGVVAVGGDVVLLYFTRVLPAHAHAELAHLGQESLATVLYHLGVDGQTAMHLAGLQYAVTCFIGIFVARKMYRADGDAAWLVLVPAGFAVVGGEFIHLTEMAVLVPLAVLFATRHRSTLAFAALVMFAVPFETAVSLVLYLPAAALAVAWLLLEARARGIVVVAASLAVVGVGLGVHGIAVAQVAHSSTLISDPGPDALASVTWEAYSSLTGARVLWWLTKLMTIAPALAFAGLMTFRALCRPQLRIVASTSQLDRPRDRSEVATGLDLTAATYAREANIC